LNLKNEFNIPSFYEIGFLKIYSWKKSIRIGNKEKLEDEIQYQSNTFSLVNV